MRTGVSYMGHHNPRHIQSDLSEMQSLQLDDMLLAAQENDFVHFPGKLRYTAEIARDMGIRPIAIFWGALNLFGGGRSSQFLLEHPEGFQTGRDGRQRAEGCYVNPVCKDRIKEMIDTVSAFGYQGYFVDEPVELKDCFCAACQRQFSDWYDEDLRVADQETQDTFRRRCVMSYVDEIASYCKANHPNLETMCCLMPHQEHLWADAARIQSLDNLGTDIYWVNTDQDVEEMTPLVSNMTSLCDAAGKKNHQWLQCWHARIAKEDRILDQGKILVREQPGALYVWAWQGQVGTDEACENPESAWAKAAEVLRLAKQG